MLIFEAEDTFMCLVSLLGIFNLLSSLLEENVLILKVFPLERKFDLRERLHVKAIGGRLGGHGGELIREPENKGVGVYL